jgi:alpha-glucosidase
MQWLDGPPCVLSFSREPGFACLVNLGGEPVRPGCNAVLLASGELTHDGLVPPDTAVWLAR